MIQAASTWPAAPVAAEIAVSSKVNVVRPDQLAGEWLPGGPLSTRADVTVTALLQLL